MQIIYIKKKNSGQSRTWLDRYIALEPMGGVGDVVRQMRNRKASRSGHAI